MCWLRRQSDLDVCWLALWHQHCLQPEPHQSHEDVHSCIQESRGLPLHMLIAPVRQVAIFLKACPAAAACAFCASIPCAQVQPLVAPCEARSTQVDALLSFLRGTMGPQARAHTDDDDSDDRSSDGDFATPARSGSPSAAEDSAGEAGPHGPQTVGACTQRAVQLLLAEAFDTRAAVLARHLALAGSVLLTQQLAMLPAPLHATLLRMHASGRATPGHHQVALTLQLGDQTQLAAQLELARDVPELRALQLHLAIPDPEAMARCSIAGLWRQPRVFDSMHSGSEDGSEDAARSDPISPDDEALPAGSGRGSGWDTDDDSGSKVGQAGPSTWHGGEAAGAGPSGQLGSHADDAAPGERHDAGPSRWGVGPREQHGGEAGRCRLSEQHGGVASRPQSPLWRALAALTQLTGLDMHVPRQLISAAELQWPAGLRDLRLGLQGNFDGQLQVASSTQHVAVVHSVSACTALTHLALAGVPLLRASPCRLDRCYCTCCEHVT